jgi:hypothetical protein
VVGKEIAVKKYVVRLSTEERAQLDDATSLSRARDSVIKNWQTSLGYNLELRKEREPSERSWQVLEGEMPGDRAS